MSSANVGLQFDPEWRLTLFAMVMIPFMVSLGFWQLQRADEKAAMAAAFEARQVQRPAPLSELWDMPAGSMGYLPVQLSGTFLQEQYFLLDNRMHSGQFGYEVLGILRTESGAAVLVNRGWLAGDPSRRELPQVPQVPGRVALTGYVYVAPGAPYLLAEQELASS